VVAKNQTRRFFVPSLANTALGSRASISPWTARGYNRRAMVGNAVHRGDPWLEKQRSRRRRATASGPRRGAKVFR